MNEYFITYLTMDGLVFTARVWDFTESNAVYQVSSRMICREVQSCEIINQIELEEWVDKYDR